MVYEIFVMFKFKITGRSYYCSKMKCVRIIQIIYCLRSNEIDLNSTEQMTLSGKYREHQRALQITI